VILVDTNVIMYAAGAPHAFKSPSISFLERVARGEEEAIIDAEVLQEILHRYRALRRWEDGRRVFDLARTLFPVVLPITDALLDRTRGILDAHPALMARDGLHAAVVLSHDLDAICSFDRDFDGIPGVRRRQPA
jgi:uncharacterized protein